LLVTTLLQNYRKLTRHMQRTPTEESKQTSAGLDLFLQEATTEWLYWNMSRNLAGRERGI